MTDRLLRALGLPALALALVATVLAVQLPTRTITSTARICTTPAAAAYSCPVQPITTGCASNG